jgi:hypothetical protein
MKGVSIMRMQWVTISVVMLGLSGIAAGAASEGSDSIPYIFEAGDTARAEQINTNFDYLSTELRKLGSDVTDLKSELAASDSTVAFLKENLPPADFANLLGADSVKWRLADGSAGTDEYKVAITQNLPDLRGMFLRGLNVGRSDNMKDPNGSGRVAGDVQGDTLKSHNHENGEYKYLLRLTGIDTPEGCNDTEGEPNVTTAKNIKTYGGLETRPKNVAVYWYIKVK